MFVANRDVEVATTHGIALNFKKGVPQQAPRAIHSILIEKGILPVDENGEIETDTITEVTANPAGQKAEPEDAGERADAIEQAMRIIVKRNKSNDFSGGTPSAQAVSAILGWRTDQKEVRKVWTDKRVSIIGVL
jgi:hypothetical protein